MPGQSATVASATLAFSAGQSAPQRVQPNSPPRFARLRSDLHGQGVVSQPVGMAPDQGRAGEVMSFGKLIWVKV